MQSTSGRLRHVRAPRAIHFPSEAEVPETKLHFKLRTALFLLLTRELSRHACIGSDQFVYWNARDPRRCLAPDAFVKLGRADETFDSWKTWERGTPELAVEILSENEDWQEKLDRYHELGVRELVSFDPAAERLRVWDRVQEDLVERVIGRGATPCTTLRAFFVVAPVDGAPALRLARDAAGRDLWLSPAEHEARARAAAEKRVAELEKKLRRRRR
jgi:hypothetical protein